MNSIEPIGNDIIDWQIAKTQHQKLRNRCLEKLFSVEEINYILSIENPLKAFWHLWSVKESAYKAWQRICRQKPIFNPLSFRCCVVSPKLASVSSKNFNCRVETTFCNQYIYSQCQSKTNKFKIFSSKKEAFEFINQWQNKDWIIHKNKYNIPILIHKAKNLQQPISISHDYDFVAFNW